MAFDYKLNVEKRESCGGWGLEEKEEKRQLKETSLGAFQFEGGCAALAAGEHLSLRVRHLNKGDSCLLPIDK